MAAVAAVTIAIVDTWDQVRRSLANAAWGWAVAALPIAGAGMAVVAVNWRTVTAALGGRMSRRQAVVWYFLGEIGKYLPGGVWPVLGRSELARRAGVPGATSFGGVMVSLGALYLCAALVVAVGTIASGRGPVAIGVAVVALVLAVGALHPRITGIGAGLLRRLSRGRVSLPSLSFGVALGLVLRYVPAWALIGSATWCVARAFDPDVGLLDVGTATAAAWIVGFVAVPVPGGVGVREAVFLALVPGLPTSVAATVAVAARLVFMVIDGVGALAGAARLRSVGASAPRVPPSSG